VEFSETQGVAANRAARVSKRSARTMVRHRTDSLTVPALLRRTLC
jgi:hypothetical protein